MVADVRHGYLGTSWCLFNIALGHPRSRTSVMCDICRYKYWGFPSPVRSLNSAVKGQYVVQGPEANPTYEKAVKRFINLQTSPETTIFLLCRTIIKSQISVFDFRIRCTELPRTCRA